MTPKKLRALVLIGLIILGLIQVGDRSRSRVSRVKPRL